MKAAEIRNLSAQELNEKVASESENLTKLKLTQVVSELSNPTQLKYKRKVIARLLTEKRSRELAENK